MWVTIQWVTMAVFGSVFGHQIFLHQHHYRMISKKTLVFLEIILLPAYIFLIFLNKSNLFQMVLTLLSLVMVSYFTVIVRIWYRRQQFQALRLPFLNALVLHLKAGQSLREALLTLKNQKHFGQSVDIQELTQALVYEDESFDHSFLVPEAQKLIKVLLQIHMARFQVTERLVFLRNQFQRQDQFDKKQRNATAQVRAQLMVCASLYISVILMTLFKQPQFLLSRAFGISLALFVLGILLVYRIPALFKFKI